MPVVVTLIELTAGLSIFPAFKAAIPPAWETPVIVVEVELEASCFTSQSVILAVSSFLPAIPAAYFALTDAFGVNSLLEEILLMFIPVIPPA